MADINNKNNGNGTDNKDQKKDNIFKRAWTKVPGWGKKAIKIAGVLGLAAGAYTLGKGSSDEPDWQALPEPEDDVVAEQ